MTDDILAVRGSLRAAMSAEPRMVEASARPDEIVRVRTVAQIKRALYAELQDEPGFRLCGTPRSYREADARALASE